MDFRDLKPEEKLFYAIMGEPAEIKHFLTPEGCKAVHKALTVLSQREQRVLKLRIGLEDGITRSLREVGKELDVTRERIRQVEGKALRRLRHASIKRVLQVYCD